MVVLLGWFVLLGFVVGGCGWWVFVVCFVVWGAFRLLFMAWFLWFRFVGFIVVTCLAFGFVGVCFFVGVLSMS